MTSCRVILMLLACIALVQHADANVRGLYGLPLKLIKRMKHKYDKDLKLKEPPYKYNKEILDALPSSKRMIKSKDE